MLALHHCLSEMKALIVRLSFHKRTVMKTIARDAVISQHGTIDSGSQNKVWQDCQICRAVATANGLHANHYSSRSVLHPDLVLNFAISKIDHIEFFSMMFTPTFWNICNVSKVLNFVYKELLILCEIKLSKIESSEGFVIKCVVKSIIFKILVLVCIKMERFFNINNLSTLNCFPP